MVDINKRLKHIMKEYEIEEKKDILQEYIEFIIKKELEHIQVNDKVIFLGDESEIQYVIALCNFQKYTINNLEHEISIDNCDFIIMTANQDINIDIIKSFSLEDKRIICLRNVFQKYNFLMEEARKGFYSKISFIDYKFHPYEKIVILKQYLNDLSNIESKAKIMRSIIYNYIQIKDFINVIDNINQYIKNKYYNWENYKKFSHELKSFLDEIKLKVKERKHKDVIVSWNDSFYVGDVCEHTPFLQEVSEHSLFFSQAYTYTPFTSATTKIIFQKLRQIDEDAYNNDNFIASDSKLYRLVEKNGFALKYIGITGIGDKLDLDSSIVDDDWTPGMVRYWNLLNELVNCDYPIFAIVHSLVETHAPYLSPDLINMKWFYFDYIEDYNLAEIQKNISNQYWDRQLQYYFGFINDNTTKIIMSDHGNKAVPRYCEQRLHVYLAVIDNNIPKFKCDRIFSLFNFVELIDYVLNITEEKFEDMFNQNGIIAFQDADTYGLPFVEYYIRNNMQELGMAFRGAQSVYDKYVKIGNGKEYYYLLPDEDTNLVDDKEFKERISVLKRAAGNKFLDIYQNENFQHSVRLYE